MNRLTVSLLRTIGISWAGFVVAGILISLLGIPTVVILINRSFCQPSAWQQVTQTYAQLYQQSQQRRIQISTVVLFSSLGQEVLSVPPTPDRIRDLSTYGKPDPVRTSQLQATYPQARLLSCPKN